MHPILDSTHHLQPYQQLQIVDIPDAELWDHLSLVFLYQCSETQYEYSPQQEEEPSSLDQIHQYHEQQTWQNTKTIAVL